MQSTEDNRTPPPSSSSSTKTVNVNLERSDRTLSYRAGSSSWLFWIGMLLVMGLPSVSADATCSGSTNQPICDPLPNGNSCPYDGYNGCTRAGSLGGVVDDLYQDYRDGSGNTVSKPAGSMSTEEAIAKHGPIDTWDTSQVTNMKWVFYNKKNINPDVRKWRVESVENMQGMFQSADSFNIDLSGWIVSSVTNMNYMFNQATAYTQVLCGSTWVESTASKSSMFDSAGSGAKIGTEICSCSPGNYLTTTTPKACTDCTNGKYQDELGFTGSSCTKDCNAAICCSYGKYLSAANTCDDCLNGKYQDEYPFVGAVCKGCSAGKWSNSGGLFSDNSCTSCDAGRYSTIGKGQTSIAECDNKCSPGKWSNQKGLASDNDCTPCVAGRYSISGEAQTSIDVCLACVAGHYSTVGEGQTSITACENKCSPGKWSSQVGSGTENDCTSCVAGRYSISGEAQTSIDVCLACVAGRYSISGEAAQTSIDVCLACVAGRYSSGEAQILIDVCLACIAGKYSISGEAQTSSIVCKFCSDGFYNDEPGKTDCIGCPRGRYLKAKDNENNPRAADDHNEELDCKVCKSNTYQDKVGQENCPQCPDGKVITDNEGNPFLHNNITKCQDAPIYCEAPTYFADNGQCELCPKGSYCDGISRFECNYGAYCPGDGTKSLCPAGTYGDSSGQVTLSTCKNCDIGTYNKIPGSTSCSNRCPPGTYNSEKEGSASLEEACIPCPIGSFCSVGSRISCPKGTYNDEIRISSSDGCTKCRRNTYNDKNNGTKEDDCIPCSKDVTGKLLRTKEGAVSVTECELTPFICDVGERPIFETEIDDDCEDCPKGTYGSNGESCTLCPIGYFQEQKAQTKCKKCTDIDTCSTFMPGATSKTDSLQTASLPTEFAFAQDNNGNDEGNITGAVLTYINADLEEIPDGLVYSTSTAIIVLLGSIALTFVLFHRYLPMRFKDADLLYAGFHFIEDTVSIHKLFCFGVFIFIHSLRIHQNQIYWSNITYVL
jgi:surface protein